MGANLFQQYLQAPKSVMDYESEMDDAQRRRNILMRQDMELKANADQMQQQQATRNALQQIASGWRPETTMEQRIQSLRSNPLTFGQADALEKQYTERRDKEADIAKKTADTGKVTAETLDAGLKRYRGVLDYVDTPQKAAQWVAAMHADPVVGQFVSKIGSPQEMVSSIPTDPAGFQRWRQEAAMGVEKVLEVGQKQRDFQLRANNELIGPDGTPNQTLIGVKAGLAKAGAPSVTVNTGQKGFDNTLKLRGDFRSEPVYKAHQEMQSAYSQIQSSLQQGSPIGDTAAATKIMKLLDPGSVVRESELGMAMAATGMLDRVQNYAQNILNGTKLTPQQRKDFQALADSLYGQSAQLYNTKRAEYKGIADRNGLNVADVLGSESDVPAPTPKPAKASKPAAVPAGVPPDIAALLKKHGGGQ